MFRLRWRSVFSSRWDLWWESCFWYRSFSEYFRFTPVGVISPLFRTQLFIYHWRYAVLATDSFINTLSAELTLILLTWRIWSTPNNASRRQMGFNSAFKGLNPIFHLLTSFGSHHILHISRIRVK